MKQRLTIYRFECPVCGKLYAIIEPHMRMRVKCKCGFGDKLSDWPNEEDGSILISLSLNESGEYVLRMVDENL